MMEKFDVKYPSDIMGDFDENGDINEFTKLN